jgi:hypothetical protein
VKSKPTRLPFNREKFFANRHNNGNFAPVFGFGLAFRTAETTRFKQEIF